MDNTVILLQLMPFGCSVGRGVCIDAAGILLLRLDRAAEIDNNDNSNNIICFA